MITRHDTDNWKQIESASKAVLPADIVEFIEKVRQEDHPESQLIAVLHKVQDHYGYLGREQMDAVGQLLRVPTAKVSGVASFYHYFRLQPKGRFIINVCMGTACYVKGAERVVDKIKQELGIDFGETTKDGLFTMEQARCLGTCGLAPVIMINDDVHAKITPDQIPALLSQYASKLSTPQQR